VAELVAGVDGRQRLCARRHLVAGEDGHEVVARKVGRVEADEAGRRAACRDEVWRGQGRRHQARMERGRQFGKAIVERQVVGGGEIDDASFG
jgi:hypothetical protein